MAKLTDEIRRIHRIRPATADESKALGAAQQSWHDQVLASQGPDANCFACPACRAKLRS